MEGIRQWIEAEGSGHWFFIAFPVVLLCLFVWFKGRRVRFLIPSLIISIVIINPWFYRVWDELGLYAYWRILWIIPVIPVLAGLVPSLTERIQKDWIKTVVAAVGVGLVAFCGTFLYNGTGGSFVEAANASKEPDYVVQIADRLLELEDRPRVIAQDPVGVYIRQYTGEIDSLFGRDITANHITLPSRMAVNIHSILNDPEEDIKPVSQLMLDNDYEYLVMSKDREINGSFHLLDCIGSYGIYTPIGAPTVKNERNSLGQIISVTNIDENGNPKNNENGYAKTLYEYDNNGYTSREFHLDDNGFAVADDDGIAGYEWQRNADEEVFMERTLDIDGDPVIAFSNYAEVRREYKDGFVIRESYYGTDRNLIPQIAGHVAIVQDWDGDRLVSRTYLDTEGKPMNRVDGYSKVDWSSEEVVFYDVNGEQVSLEGINLFKDIKVNSDGWSDWYTPSPNERNYCFNLGSIQLGENEEGDNYSCQIEIEFKDVAASEEHGFYFCSQGDADKSWDIGNPWNYCVYLTETPADGIYQYSQTISITDKMADASYFNISFRCDYWKSGSFRVRRIKIEKSEQVTDWSPGI